MSTKLPPRHHHDKHLLIDQSEGVVEHKVAACAVRKKLEDLGVIHRSLFLVDLQSDQYVNQGCPNKVSFLLPGLTSNAPVTMTSIPPLSFEGCASSVDN